MGPLEAAPKRRRPKRIPKGTIIRLRTPIAEMTVIEDDGNGSVLVFRRGISGWVRRDDIEIL